jgi:hypothetical protein
LVLPEAFFSVSIFGASKGESMSTKPGFLVAVFLMAVGCLFSWGPSIPVQAADESKLEERLAQMEKRLAQMEKMLMETEKMLLVLRDAATNQPLSQTISDGGEASVPPNDLNKGEIEVYYRIPFASPPKVTIVEGANDSWTITEQKADHFTAKNTSAFGRKMTWKAEGLPAREKAK